VFLRRRFSVFCLFAFFPQIISGQQLPKHNDEVIDPFITVEIIGLACDHRLVRTKTVHNNGLNPFWNEQFTFNVLCPELAMVYIELQDDDITTQAEPVGFFVIPLLSIMQVSL
jgi:Ca2+-dependent lipid-binding protein